MNIISFLQDTSFNDGKVQIDKMYETSFSKEIRICMAKGNIMQEHAAPGPITIFVIEGKVAISSLGNSVELNNGEMVCFDAKVSHSLEALQESVIRLTLSKNDSDQRVFSLVKG